LRMFDIFLKWCWSQKSGLYLGLQLPFCGTFPVKISQVQGFKSHGFLDQGRLWHWRWNRYWHRWEACGSPLQHRIPSDCRQGWSVWHSNRQWMLS
jgi:hypothetical protein